MTGSEKKIDRLLTQAHQLAWQAGRYDMTVQIIKAITMLRGITPRPLPDNRSDDELDLAEEAFAQGVDVREINK